MSADKYPSTFSRQMAVEEAEIQARRDNSEKGIAIVDSGFDLVGSLVQSRQHGVASNEVISW